MRPPSSSLEIPANLHPTAASTRKLGRARHHGNEVLQALDSFGRHGQVRREVDVRQLNGIDYKVVSGIPDQPPPDIDLVFGDYVQNLRAALDYLVGEMRRDGPSDKSAFPICRTPDAFKAACTDKLNGISRAAVDLIEGMQVYDHVDLSLDPQRSVYLSLRWLETLWNIDKHRTIVLTTTAIEFMDATRQSGEGESGIGFDLQGDGSVGEIWIPVAEEAAVGPTNFYPEVRLAKPSGYVTDWPSVLDQIGMDGVVTELFRTVAWRVLMPLGRFIR